MSVSYLVRGLLVLATVTFSMSFAGVANAQDGADADDGGGLEEIVVTATRRTENLQDVPITINAFSADMIENQRILDYADLANAIPSFAINTFSKTRFVPILRGGGSSLYSAGAEGSVGLYIDDIYYGGAGDFEIDLFDVERIEVLRGPQGTLFGRNTTGGSINVITRNPSEEAAGKIEVTYGNYDYLQVRGFANGQLFDNVYGLVAATSTSRGGTSYNRVTGNNVENMNKSSIRGKLLWDVSESLDVIASLGLTVRDETGVARNAIFEPVPITQSLLLDYVPNDDPRTIDGFTDGRYEQDQVTLGLRVEKDLNSGQLLSITSFRNMETKDALTSLAGVPEPMFAIGEPRDISTFSQEFRFVSNNDGPFNYVAGLYVYLSDDKRTLNSTTHWDASTVGGSFQAITFCPDQDPADFDEFQISDECFGDTLVTIGNRTVTYDSLYTPNSFTVNDHVKTRSYAVFGEGTYDISDAIRVTAGLRWTTDEKDLESGTMEGDPDFFWNPEPGLNVSGSDDWSEMTYRLGLSWNINDNVMLFATTSKGFRSGAFDVAQSDTSLSNVAVAPEIAYSHEFGMKSNFFNNRMQLNVTLFDVTYEDLQFFVNTGASSVTTNAGEASVNGYEIDFIAMLTDDLQFRLQYAHQEGDSKDIPVEAEIPDGTPPGGTIPKTIIAALQYETELDSGGSLFASISYTKKDAYGLEFNDVPQFVSEIDGMVNARLDYTFANQKWQLAVWGKNLTDEDVIIYGQDFWFTFYDTPSFVGNPEVIDLTAQPRYADPRTYGVTLSYTF